MALFASPGADSLLRQRSFVAFWLARTVSMFNFQMLNIVVSWQIYSVTGRAFDLGLIGLAQFLPSVLLALPAGHIADQFDRRRIVLIGQFVEWFAIAKMLEAPALLSMLPALVLPNMLARVMAANSAAGQAAMMVGPALGGLLYVAGAGSVYLAASLLYLISMLMVSRLRYVQEPVRRVLASFATLFAGVRFIRARPDVLSVISLDLFAVLLGGATALLPIFAKDILHTGPWGLGLLRGAPAVGRC